MLLMGDVCTTAGMIDHKFHPRPLRFRKWEKGIKKCHESIFKYTRGTPEITMPIFKKSKNNVKNYHKIILHSLRYKLFFYIIAMSA